MESVSDASTGVREPIGVDYQCATKSCSAWKQSLIVWYVFRAKFNVKTDESPRAGWTELAGRIWRAGRTLPTPVLEERCFNQPLESQHWMVRSLRKLLTEQLLVLCLIFIIFFCTDVIQPVKIHFFHIRLWLIESVWMRLCFTSKLSSSDHLS